MQKTPAFHLSPPTMSITGSGPATSSMMSRCIRHRVSLDDSARFRRPNAEYFLKDHKEMLLLPGLPPEAISRTRAVAEAYAFELDFSSYCFPDFVLPPGEAPCAYLRRLCDERAPVRYGGISDEVKGRLEQELALIERKGLCGYFLIVWDIMEFARRNGILSQGRGSAASSLVAYLLGITPVDPIRHGLFVGRFLNESSAVPDIDIDIDTRRREEVIHYVYEKYGEEHAGHGMHLRDISARNAIREVGKGIRLPVIISTGWLSVLRLQPGLRHEDLKNVPRSDSTSIPRHGAISAR